MPLSKAGLLVLNNTNFPNNTTQYISPELLREFNTEMVAALQLTQSMSEYAVLSGGNSFIGSQNITGDLTVTGTLTVPVIHTIYETASVIYSSGSNQLGDELTDTQTLSGSVKVQGSLTINGIPVTAGQTTGSSLITASVLNNVITFTKGDLSQFNITVNTGSANYTDLTSLNAYTASNDVKWNTLGTLTGSYATTGSNSFKGNQYIDKTNAIYSNALYWTSSEVGYNNLEIINQGGGNLDFASLNGGKMRVVNTPLILTGSALSSSNDISTSANIYAANLTASAIPTGTISSSAQISALGFVSSSVTASSLITASLSGQTLTFTKGNGTTFGIVLPDVSGSDITSLNAFTASQLDINTGYNTFTASANSSISNLNSATASLFNSASLALITASFDNGTRNLTFTKGDTQTFSVNIPDVSGSAGTFVTTSSFNAYTASNDQRVSSLETNSASVNISISNLNASSASQQLQINSLIAATGSYVTSAITASSLITASFSGNTLTFTKGDSSTFGVVIPDISGSTFDTGSFVSTSSFNQYTSSTNNRLNNLETTSASVNISISNLNSTTASQAISISNLNTYTQSNDAKWNTLGGQTGSYVTSAITASSLVTASVNLNTITFTKGDASTFAITVNTGSGGGSTDITSLNAFTQSILGTNPWTASIDQKFATIGGQSGSWGGGGGAISVQDEGTILGNATSFNFNGAGVTATLSAGTASITIPGGGGSSDTGSLLVTASFNTSTRDITFTKGDASTFKLGAFAITGSNTFVGSQTINSSNALTISSSAGFGYGITLQGQQGISIQGSGGPRINFPNDTWLNGNENDDFQFTGDTNNPKTRGISFFLYGTGSRNMSFRNDSGPSAQINFQTTGSGSPFTNLSLTQNQSTFGRVLRLADWNSNSIISMINVSGSLSLIPSSFNATTASLLHLSASNNNQFVNLVFKNNNGTGDTIISGSNNIFTNPGTPTTGYKKYVGGANNFYLNSSNGINSEITASAISVSGVRPVMNNNIFQGTAALTINQAVNGGTHTYSNNLFAGINVTTINALAYTGSNFTVSDNIFKGGAITINPASASLAEIAAGVSGSGGTGFQIDRNTILGTGGMTINVGPKTTTGFTSVLSNVINAGQLTITNISSSVNVNSTGNFANGGMTYTNAGAAGLALHRNSGTMNSNYGAMNLIASASAIAATGNICSSALTVTNRMYSGSLGSGSLSFNTNAVQGNLNTYTVSGSYNGTGPTQGAVFANNAIYGARNTFFTNVEGRGNYVNFSANGIFGNSLILTGSNNTILIEEGGAHIGRYNADDGRRNTTGENIFSVGTGTSTARKTGFLIDSGSNTFIEGTLNVSGSTTMTGSLSIQSGSALPSATGSSVLTWNATTGQVGQSTFTNLLSASLSIGEFYNSTTLSGSAGVSQSIYLPTTGVSNGLSIQNNSQIVTTQTGTYNIQFSAQCDAFGGADTIWIWFKKNEVNIADSASKLIMQNNTAAIMTVNIFDNATAGDYYEVVWQNNAGTGILVADAATGNIPAVPSVIVTINEIR